MSALGIFAASLAAGAALWLLGRAGRRSDQNAPSSQRAPRPQTEGQLAFTRLIEERSRARRERDAALLAKSPAANRPREERASDASHHPLSVGPEAVTALVRARGYETLLDFLRAHPAVSLVGISDEIEGPPAVVLSAVAVREALDRREMGFLVRDLIVREFHAKLPDGWSAGKDYEREGVFFLSELRREPYVRLVERMKARCAGVPVPSDWLPSNADDPLLVSLYEGALAELDAADQKLVGEGAMIPAPGDAYRKAMGPYWDKVDIYEDAKTFLAGYAEVPRPIAHVLAAHWCKSEIDNGGFRQLFENSTGVLVPEGIEGFEAIGLTEAAGVVRTAAALLGGAYPRQRKERQAAVGRCSGEGDEDPFEALDGEFYASAVGFEGAADAHVAKA
ncbi:MAG TPA: DUF4375 domain-containing protein [Polyangiaceae bacterium]